ncbi:MAG: hypothetical protein O7G32_03625, partial [SAR324 cluster bacterium]|nr:hypothetical protein [SAR324 cluster bacterium]
RDERECRKQFKIARGLQPHDWWIETSYATALQNLEYVSEARAIARDIYDSNGSDLDVLDHLIYLNMISGRALEADQLLKNRAKLKPKGEHPEGKAIAEFSAFYRKHELHDDDVEASLNITIKVLHEAGYISARGDFGVRRDGESEWLSGLLKVAAPVERIVELNAELADSLAVSSVAPEIANLVNFMFVPASD